MAAVLDTGRESGGGWRARIAVGALGLCSVIPLLAWVYGLGSFAAWFWRLAFPAAVVLGAVAWRASRPERMRPRPTGSGPSW